MEQELYDILYKYWGYEEFRPLQKDIITSILEGHDTLGLLPTGGGKSITFQVPTLLLDGLALVITPIISLMKDQVDGLVKKGIKATYLHSGLTMGEMNRAIDKCIYGNCKFLYISPERLGSKSFLDKLRLMNVSLMVVDEAHCISQWGYDFRPSYLGISKVRKVFTNIPVLALTASATPEVAKDIVEQLDFSNHKVFSKSFARDNLSYVVRHSEDKFGEMLRILQSVPGSGIVYVRSRKKTKEIALDLQAKGIPATYYHAGLSREEKEDKQNKWISNQFRIMVATNAFGMGIDKPDVRIVIHTDIPSSLEEYYQEAGRAGRDGNRSYVVLLVSKYDKTILNRRIANMFPSKEFIRIVYEQVGNFLSVPLEGGFNQTYEFNFVLFCRQNHFPVSPTFNALKILTQSGYIDFIEEIDTQSRIMILAKKEELYHIDSDNTKIDTILQILLRSYTGLFADYVYINEDALSYKYGFTSEDIYNALIELNRKHILHYIPRKRTPYIFYTTSRELPKYILLPKTCYEDRKQRVENRINAMLEYSFEENTCRENMILRYFGEDRKFKCGHCDNCIREKKESSSTLVEDIDNGILYLLSLRERKTNEFIDNLSFPKDCIKDELRRLLSEDIIRYDPETGIYSVNN